MVNESDRRGGSGSSVGSREQKKGWESCCLEGEMSLQSNHSRATHHAISYTPTHTPTPPYCRFLSSFLSPMVSPLLLPDVKVCQQLDELVVQYMALIDEHLSVLNRVGDKFQQVNRTLDSDSMLNQLWPPAVNLGTSLCFSFSLLTLSLCDNP